MGSIGTNLYEILAFPGGGGTLPQNSTEYKESQS